MQSNEIKPGDIVYIDTCYTVIKDNPNPILFLIVEYIEENSAHCYWTYNGDIRHTDIPIIVLKKLEN